MLNILIVEDQGNKLQEMRRSIAESNADIAVIDSATCINEAKKLLRNNYYDLMILDIQLPENPDTEILKDGGIRLIQNIKDLDFFQIPKYMIGVTHFQESLDEYQEFFQTELSYIIKHDNSSISCAVEIKRHLVTIHEKIYREKYSRYRPYEYDVAILCALETPELSEILKLPFNWAEKTFPSDPTIYFKGYYDNGTKRINLIASYCPHMGMSSSASLAMKMITQFKPRFIAMTGICAGVKSADRSEGDILIPDVTYDYGSGKYSVDGESGETLFINEPQQYRISAEVKSNIEAIRRDSQFIESIRREAFAKKICSKIPEKLSIHIGAIGSGSAVVSDEKLINEKKVTQTRRLIGIEMEIYGLFSAAYNSPFPSPIPIAMKSICDWGDNKKDDEFQKYASFTSAKLLEKYIQTYI